MRKILLSLVVLVFTCMVPLQASAIIELLDGDVRIDGYMRGQMEVFTNGGKAGEFAQFRGTLQIEGQFRFAENTTLVTIFRGVRQSLGNYSKDRGVNERFYDENWADPIRECYLDIVYPGITIRAGKQQVIWGETDFFRSADIINPIDFSWRTFLEDWQDIRIPNWMLVINKDIPDCRGGGQLELIWRPGLDDAADVVDKFAPSGGVWDIRHPAFPPGVNLDLRTTNPGSGLRNGSGGFRYLNEFSALGTIFNYTFNYFYGWQESPNFYVNGFDAATNTILAELKYRRLNVFGSTANFSIDKLQSVVRVEFSFQRNRGYTLRGAESSAAVNAHYPKGVMHKNLIRYAIGWDCVPTAKWTKWWSRQPWMYSIQLFQDVIVDWDDDEFIQRTGEGGRYRDVETVITFFFNGHYWWDRIQPQLAGGYDDMGAWFFIPSCNFAYGDHWRAKVEWDWFSHDNDHPLENIAYLSSNSAIQVKLTYQF
jgi:hypothetical protein